MCPQSSLAVRLHHEVVGARRLRCDRNDASCPVGAARERLAAGRVEEQIAGLAFLSEYAAEGADELHCYMPYAASGAGDKHALARLEPTVDNESLPCAQPRHRQCRRLFVAQVLRLRREHGLWHDRVVGRDAIAVERRERDHLFAARLDDIGELVGRDCR
jgi:hypothetical protein